ncbi:MAG: hypothetical protein IJA13_00250, partial [Clostridia bacterium]|nr:hypothetical protein [Clostridia bacterium]
MLYDLIISLNKRNVNIDFAVGNIAIKEVCTIEKSEQKSLKLKKSKKLFTFECFYVILTLFRFLGVGVYRFSVVT